MREASNANVVFIFTTNTSIFTNIHEKLSDPGSRNAEGANHVAYQVDDLEKEVKELENKGVPVMYHAKGAYAYLDSSKVGGVVIELFQKRNKPPTP